MMHTELSSRKYRIRKSDNGHQLFELDIKAHLSQTPPLIRSGRAVPSSPPFHVEWGARSKFLLRLSFAGHTVVSVS
jgi:hypothetical protein